MQAGRQAGRQGGRQRKRLVEVGRRAGRVRGCWSNQPCMRMYVRTPPTHTQTRHTCARPPPPLPPPPPAPCCSRLPDQRGACCPASGRRGHIRKLPLQALDQAMDRGERWEEREEGATSSKNISHDIARISGDNSTPPVSDMPHRMPAPRSEHRQPTRGCQTLP